MSIKIEKINTDFPCDSCGLCCRHIDRSDATKILNRGDGACIYFIDQTSKCQIYSDRPDFCRVKESFHLFEAVMTLSEYYKANARICNTLHRQHGLINLIEIEI